MHIENKKVDIDHYNRKLKEHEDKRLSTDERMKYWTEYIIHTIPLEKVMSKKDSIDESDILNPEKLKHNMKCKQCAEYGSEFCKDCIDEYITQNQENG
jgi:hypothetical protein